MRHVLRDSLWLVDFGFPPSVAAISIRQLRLVGFQCWKSAGRGFAPGFFVWNSEVGSRRVGIHTFWYQHICGNHIVWDCTDVNEFSRKHTSSVRDAIGEIERMIASLVAVKTQRQEQFAAKIRASKRQQLGRDLDEVTKLLRQQNIPLGMIKNATKVVRDDHSAFAWVAGHAAPRTARLYDRRNKKVTRNIVERISI